MPAHCRFSGLFPTNARACYRSTGQRYHSPERIHAVPKSGEEAKSMTLFQPMISRSIDKIAVRIARRKPRVFRIPPSHRCAHSLLLTASLVLLGFLPATCIRGRNDRPIYRIPSTLSETEIGYLKMALRQHYRDAKIDSVIVDRSDLTSRNTARVYFAPEAIAANDYILKTGRLSQIAPRGTWTVNEWPPEDYRRTRFEVGGRKLYISSTVPYEKALTFLTAIANDKFTVLDSTCFRPFALERIRRISGGKGDLESLMKVYLWPVDRTSPVYEFHVVQDHVELRDVSFMVQ